MAINTDTTTLVCLFHHADQAGAALDDLRSAGIPESSITVYGNQDGATPSSDSLALLGIPQRDMEHLHDGLSDGGSIVAVHALTDHVETVERIFGQHRAEKIDEAVTEDETALPLAAGMAGAGEVTVPIVEESIAVGKRTVDQGGVRVYKRVVEIPADATVQLREEHVTLDRRPVDRPATATDLAAQGTRSIELTETAEEAVVGKTAHVVEEVVVGKQTGERTEHIQDTVRRTEVEIEEIPADARTISTDRNL